MWYAVHGTVYRVDKFVYYNTPYLYGIKQNLNI